MQVIQIVFCIVSVAFAAAQKISKCTNKGFEKVLVTINEDYSPFWYQMYFVDCLQGNNVPEIPAYTISISKSTRFNNIIRISNFPLLKELYLDNSFLKNIPHLDKLPNITILSLIGNMLQEILKEDFGGLPVNEVLLTRNSINTIEEGAFGDNVTKIFLTCNNISTLSPSWFRNPASLKELKLAGNKITQLPDNMFRDFVNLDILELRNNQIKTLGVGSISGPTSMRRLDLAYNNISEIRADVFGPHINVTYFVVEYNRLSFLHQAMMDKMTARVIELWGNPWQCPCQKIIDKWVTKNNERFSLGLPRDEDPSCVTALSFKNICIPYVDDDLYETFLMNFELTPVKICRQQ